MSVIIRLQGLPWSASAMNIRHFFAGLNIPAGGVHIIGGEGGDAFIAFSSDDDARMAMKKNMCPLNGTTVQLFLSSKAEMQSVIDAARAGSSTSASAVTPSTPQSQQQPVQQQQPRQPFSSTSAFPVDNTSQSIASSGVFPGQQMNDFNQHTPSNQFPRGDWQGFQAYGGRGDDQSQQMSSQFQYNQRMPGSQGDGRFASGPAGFDRAPYGSLQQQQDGQFHDTSGVLSQTNPTSVGMGGLYPGVDMTQKPSGFGEQVGGRQGGIPGSTFDNTSLLGNMGSMGRGQSSFPGQFGVGPNRNTYPGMDKLQGDDSLARTSSVDDKSLGDSMDIVAQGDKFKSPFKNDPVQMGPDGRKLDMMGWADNPADARFPGTQKFEQDVHGEKSFANRENMLGPDGRPFQQFPFRGDSDRGRMNRGSEGTERADVPADSGPNRLADRQNRDSSFPGRDGRMGSRFSGGPEPEGRFAPDQFTDRTADRFSSERVQPDDMPPSTKYPPDNEVGGGEGRPRGHFPPVRGRFDDVRYPGDDRQFPPEDRFPGEDRFSNREPAYPPEGERFPEGDRKFPPGRGYLPEERRHPTDERRFPPGGRRFPPDESRYPPEDRAGMHPDRSRPEEFAGRGDDTYTPDDAPFRDRDEEGPRHRDGFGRGRRGMDDRFSHEGRGNHHRSGLRDFEEAEETRRFPPGHRFPPERPFRGEEGKEDFRGPPPVVAERRPRVSRWDREQFDDWQEEGQTFPRPTGPGASEKADFPGMADSAGIEEPMDMDQRGGGHEPFPARGPLEVRRAPLLEGRGGARPHTDVDGRRAPGMDGYRPPLIEGRGHPLEGMRGRGIEGMRGRGVDGIRGRGVDAIRGRGFEGRGGYGVEGRRGPGIPSMIDENSFDYGHGSVARGRAPPGNADEEDEEFSEAMDYDNRFPGPAARGGLFERPPRGRGDPFFRGRPGPPFGRGRGMDLDSRRFEEAGPDGRMSMDVDARNVGGRPDGPPLRPVFGDKVPDFTVKPGSGKGLLGDAPVLDRPVIPKPDMEKKDVGGDAFRRDLDNRSARRADDRDRDIRSSDRRGRDRDDRRSPDRDRSRYKYERDRSDRRRSRSRERGSRDTDGLRSRERSSSTKKDGEISKSDTQTKTESKKRCIHMRNLPVTAAFKDIRKFLEPIDVPFEGLKFTNDKQGKPSGEAFVQFRHPEDAARAFRRHGERLYGKVISISLCTDEEFTAAVDTISENKKDAAALSSTAENQKTDKDDKVRYVVQLKNLPLNITKQDIVQFFRGLTIDNNSEAVYIEYDQTGVATGNGFVEMKTDFDYKKALGKDSSLLGTVTVRVMPGKTEEADDLKHKQLEMLQRAALRNAGAPRMMQPGLQQGQPPRLQGQPPRLQGQPPRPQGQPPRLQGQPPRPPGQQLRPQGQQPRPQGQPRPPLMGPRPGMGGQQPSPAGGGQGNPNNRAPTPAEGSETVCVHIQGLPLLATPQDIREFFSDCQIAMRGINIAHDSRGKPLGEGFVEFKFKSDFEKAIKKDKTSLGRHIVAVKPIGKKEMIDRLDNARGVSTQQSGQGQISEEQSKPQSQNQGTGQSGEKQQVTQNPPGAPSGQTPQGAKPNTLGSNPSAAASGSTVSPGGSKSIPPGVLNKNWYYVRCQNFPPDITIAEILTFFQGLRPIGESIRLHYSSDGKPTGNAVVGFGSSEEAQKALRQLTMKVCRQNVVTLHPA